jgi:hypothetical protein
MDGIIIHKAEYYSVAHIATLSDALKDSIRKQLSSICHGADLAATGRNMYNYKNTLATFLTRYNTKSATIKIGMVGELLAHILIIELFENFETVSPYFNLEEKHIKKGFDVLLFENNESEVWITEVKSGQLHKDKDSTQTTKVLLATARNDLNKRLNENELNHWQNAINAARAAITQNSNYKSVVVDILMDEGDLVMSDQATGIDNNVFFVSSLFSDSDDPIDVEMVKDFYEDLEARAIFKKAVVFSIKKPTFTAVIDFLNEEVAND